MRAFDLRRIPGVTGRRPGAVPLCLIARCALTALALMPPAGAAVPLEVYGRLPRYENVVLSPDGSRIAFVRTDENARAVVVQELASGKKLGRLVAGDQKLRGIRWADNDRLMIFTSVTAVPSTFLGWNEREWRQLRIFDLKSGRSYMVPQPNPAGTMDLMNTITGRVTVRRIQDRTVLFLGGLQVMGRPERHGFGREVVTVLLRVDLESDTPRIVRTAERGLSESWTIDDAGEVAAEEHYNQRTHHRSILISRDGHMQEVAAGDEALDFPRVLGSGPIADTLLVQRIEDGDAVWRLLSLKDGSIGEPLAEKQTLDRPIEDPLTFRMIGGVHVGDSEGYVFFDPFVQQSWQAAVRAFPNERVRFESAAAGFKKMIVRVEGERDGYCYELIDLTTHRAEPLGDVYEGIGKPLEVRGVTYTAADGLQIPAYLTLPPGKPAQRLPLIVLPHGETVGRDTADFDWWSQALADQGYAVLRPNYRGSEINRAFLARGLRRVGPQDADRSVRWCALSGEGGSDRSGARLHRRRRLWRLRSTRRRIARSRCVPLRRLSGGNCRSAQLAPLGEQPALPPGDCGAALLGAFHRRQQPG